jgi:hypothetical protein
MNKNGSLVYSAPAATERYSDVVVSGVNAEDVIYDPPFTNAVQTNVEARLAQVVSVKDFGAVGDGVADDTVAIQTAMDSGATTIYFPQGVYRVTDTITQKAELLGESNLYGFASVIEMDNATPKTILVGANGQVLTDSRIKDITNMVIRGKSNQTKIHTGVFGNLYQNCISNSFFQNLDVGFDVAGVYARWEKCWISECNIGIWPRSLNANSVSAQPSTTFQLFEVVFTDCDYGFKQEVRYSTGGDTENLIQVLLLACGFEANDYGFYSTHRTWLLTIENSWFENNSSYGLYAPEVNLVEINNRHEVNSPRLVPDVDTAFFNVAVYNSEGSTTKQAKIKFIENINSGQLVYFYDDLDTLPYPTTFNGFAVKNGGYGTSGNKSGFILQADSGDNTAKTGWMQYAIRDGSGGLLAPASLVWSQLEQGATAVESEVFRLNSDGAVTPGTDDLQTLGSASNRWSDVYAGNGTIITSDAREKQQGRSLSEAEKAVATKVKSLIKAFKFNSAVDKKGENARIHFGVYAQELVDVFESEGLDAEKYSLFCYDEWFEIDGKVAVADENGEYPDGAIKKDRYGVRYDQLMAFIIATL